jgi:hypothetical protein
VCVRLGCTALRVCDGCFDDHFPPGPLPSVSIPTAVGVGEGRNAVFYYVLKVSADQASANSSGQWGVVRRYSQFEALRTRILALSAGEHGVPPALSAAEFPPKTSWFSSAAEVVAERRLGLGRWLIATRAVLMGARAEEAGMVAAVREMRQFLAADSSVKDLDPGPAAEVTASLGVLRAGGGGRSGPAAARADGAAPGSEGHGAGGTDPLLDQLGQMVSSNLGAVKAIHKEGNRQNKLLGAATEATDRGRDRVADMIDTYAHP